MAYSLQNDDQKYTPQDGIVYLYGAGGPHTALIRAAEVFTKKIGTSVEVVFGPESKWTERAQRNADIIWGTSEQSMTAFLETYKEFSSDHVEPIYMRRVVIAVPKGNPKGIKDFEDLLRPGTRIVVTEGAGVYNTSGTGVWEDVAGRLGSLSDVKAFRKNIVAYSKGSGASFRAFKELEADAWITWSHWPLTHPNDADIVGISSARVIYRDLNVVTNAKADPEATEFIEFLKGKEAIEIFKSEGWSR
ncbi:MAG: substrate-binding domain-containing protein [Verrucomicrobiota bacterium]|nr:substrate-binding domain-containing protein [Verrucomicrobiota bacterium]